MLVETELAALLDDEVLLELLVDVTELDVVEDATEDEAMELAVELLLTATLEALLDEAVVLDELELAVVVVPPPALPPPPPQADSRAKAANAARLFLTSIFISISQRSPLEVGDPAAKV